MAKLYRRKSNNQIIRFFKVSFPISASEAEHVAAYYKGYRDIKSRKTLETAIRDYLQTYGWDYCPTKIAFYGGDYECKDPIEDPVVGWAELTD